MAHPEYSEGFGFFGTRTIDVHSEDELRVSAQASVLRELFVEEEIKRLMYFIRPMDDEEARDRALQRLQEAEALSMMGKLVAGSDLRYIQEPDPMDGKGMSYRIESFNPDKPKIVIVCEATAKRDWRNWRRKWKRTYAVSVGGQPMENGEAREFAGRSLTVLERVKWKMEGMKGANTVRIPAPRSA